MTTLPTTPLIPQDNRARRAEYGHCAECGDLLTDATDLVCLQPCRAGLARDPSFLARERGHRDRIEDLTRGVRDSSLTLEKANGLYERAQATRRKAST